MSVTQRISGKRRRKFGKRAHMLEEGVTCHEQENSRSSARKQMNGGQHVAVGNKI